GSHQRLIWRNPVGEHRPLLAIPLLELDAPTPLVIAAGERERWYQALRPQLLQIRGRDGEVFESPLYLCTRQGLVTKLAHGPADRLCGEKALQQAPDPKHRAHLPFRTGPLASGIDVF